MKNYLGIDENDFQSFCSILNIDLLCEDEKKDFVASRLKNSRGNPCESSFEQFFEKLLEEAKYLKYSWEHAAKLPCGDLSLCPASLLGDKADFYGVTEKDVEEILRLREKACAFSIFCILYHRGMTVDPSNQELATVNYVALVLAAKKFGKGFF